MTPQDMLSFSIL